VSDLLTTEALMVIGSDLDFNFIPYSSFSPTRDVIGGAIDTIKNFNAFFDGGLRFSR
jgi:hypothetical protein